MSNFASPDSGSADAGCEPQAPSLGTKLPDLEIKDAHLIFESVWQRLEVEFGLQNLRFPKEILLLGGAPGAGKGTNTSFILKKNPRPDLPAGCRQRAPRFAGSPAHQGCRFHGRRS
jgi:hypothetical protein